MSENHPIEGLMQTAMESLKTMVDVNTILGDPVETPDGCVIVPVSRVSFGFAAGGTEFQPQQEDPEGQEEGELPFGGGSGGGISLNPVAFLVVGNGKVRLLPVDNTAIYDRIIDMVPQVVEQFQSMVGKGEHNGTTNQKSFDVGTLRT